MRLLCCPAHQQSSWSWGAVQELAPALDGTVVAKQVLPVLEMLREDSDYDVQFFAQRALALYAAA